ncbi:hypothetical protein [uncultured Arthrobacter sp.]|uniref:hypothetical protein n=1 Tax=uncultured Arthrobacter sp. TaxID=114050 RepID=UPI002612CA4F|nr:hypothetical protein [uncultured Arthrobacter sp.]
MDVVALLGIVSACLVVAAGTAITAWRVDVLARSGGGTDDFFWVAFGGVVVVAGAGVVAAALGGLWAAAATAAVAVTVAAGWVWRRERARRQEAVVAARTIAWSGLLGRHDTVARHWADYDLDPAKAIDHPEMHDPSHPAARRVVHALRDAETERDAGSGSPTGQPGELAAYTEAVLRAEHVFAEAEREVGVLRTTRVARHRDGPGRA